ncbi:MAG TPA: YihY/virulence factor BrkB family protein [Dongiaceae bacterium]|nr:YihY/virulence factor BrkB family protein [Dongiaceae bacterium]
MARFLDYASRAFGLWPIIRRTFQVYFAVRGPTMGAALAYYTCFSIAPLCVLIIAIAGSVFGQEAAQGALVNQFEIVMGRRGAMVVQDLIQNASATGHGFIAGLVGVVLLVVAASSVLIELEASLNIIWETGPSRQSTLMQIIRSRLLGIAIIAALGFMLLVSLVLGAVLAAFEEWLGRVAPFLDAALQYGNTLFFLAISGLLFTCAFQFLPDRRPRWRDSAIAATVTALWIAFGKGVLGLYIAHSNVASSFGAAGALIIFLIWVYYSAQVFLLGAAVTRVLGESRPRKKRQSER